MADPIASVTFRRDVLVAVCALAVGVVVAALQTVELRSQSVHASTLAAVAFVGTLLAFPALESVALVTRRNSAPFADRLLHASLVGYIPALIVVLAMWSSTDNFGASLFAGILAMVICMVSFLIMPVRTRDKSAQIYYVTDEEMSDAQRSFARFWPAAVGGYFLIIAMIGGMDERILLLQFVLLPSLVLRLRPKGLFKPGAINVVRVFGFACFILLAIWMFIFG